MSALFWWLKAQLFEPIVKHCFKSLLINNILLIQFVINKCEPIAKHKYIIERKLETHKRYKFAIMNEEL